MNFCCDHERCVLKVVKDVLSIRGGQKFILYPFGDLGKKVKSILNVYLGIQECLVVDNFLANKYDSIKSVDQLTEEDIKNATVLITSDAEEVYEQVREILYAKVAPGQCVELFPKPLPIYTPVPLGRVFTELTCNTGFYIEHLSYMQTAEYIIKNLPKLAMSENRYSLMQHIFLDDIVNIEGLYLEFGVNKGISINFIAAYNPMKMIYGFDSFEGLPEDWKYDCTAGTFNQNGIMPKVNSNVKLIKGWFDSTIPKFLEQTNESCAFIHIDCDIYSSAKTIFSLLGNRITHGTVIEFDEYFNFPSWQEHEFKAFHEFIDEYGLEYEYIGYCANGSQCAVRIK